MSATLREAPASEADLAELVADAARTDRRLEIVGGGSRRGLGGVVDADATLSTTRLSGVALYEPQALTLVAGAGARLADIEKLLAAEGQRLPFEPMDHRPLMGTKGEPTLGGMVAVNASGPRRIQAGACRDALLGVRFIDGRGVVVKNGGRVMKNVTGYDLVKLQCGAHGCLGVLTELAFRLQPIPETTATLILHRLDEATAVKALSVALGSPFDVTGAAHAGGETLVRVEGFAASIAYRAERLRETLAPFGPVDVTRDDAARWRSVRDVARFAGRQGAVWRLSLKPSDGPKALAAIRARLGVDDTIYDWGGGLVWMLTPDEGDAGAGVVRSEIARLGGHATLARASDATRRTIPPFHPESAPVAAISRGLRAGFDPAKILNPGRMAA